jgi:signal transduction histidine kinase
VSSSTRPDPGLGRLQVNAHPVFAGDSRMAARCRKFDWSGTPLGHESRWPQSLKTLASTLLASRNPMLLFWGPDLVMIYNDAFAPSLGAKRDEHGLGANGREFWTDVWQVIGAQLESVLERGETVWFENALVPIEREGMMHDAWWTYSYSPVRDESGDVAGILVVCQETTAHVLAENKLREAVKALAAANRAKTDFLAVMSHELRTPLNAIDGYAELLEMGVHGPITELQMQDIVRIRKSQRHLLTLINGVLDFTRVEAGAAHYDLSPVSLASVLASCDTLMRTQMEHRGLTFHVDVCSADLAVLADAEKLQQILLNLLTNASKFTPSGGSVRMWCDALPENVRVTVEDTGRGIPPEQITRVFEAFVQVDSRLTRTEDGIGLGLAISRDLARAMNGEISVVSEVGRGSAFTVTIPRALPRSD